MIALSFGLFGFGVITGIDIVLTPTFYFILIFLFYWIDASVLAARRSDPLLRDTLRWSTARIVLWALNIATFVITISVLSYFIALTGSMPPRPPGFLIFLLFLPYYVVLPGIVYVIVGALRSKDPTPRKNLIWFGLFMAALIPSFLLPTGDIITSLLFDVAIFLSAYFLFRSARSLAPINRLSKEIVSKGSGM